MSKLKIRPFPALLILVCVCLAGALALTLLRLQAAEDAAGGAGRYDKGYFQGYSIFDETMVELPWPAVEQAAKDGAAVLLPVGPIEEHGPQMSLGVDCYMSYLLCKLARRELARMGIKAVIAPPTYWCVNSVGGGTGGFPGSFTLRQETLSALIYDELASLKSWGFKRIYIISPHGDGGHKSAMLSAIMQAYQEMGVAAFELFPNIDYRGPINIAEVHAGAFETGFMAAFFPGEIDAGIARSLKAESSFAPLGYIGDPSLFSAKGMRAAYEAAGKDLARQIRDRLNR